MPPLYEFGPYQLDPSERTLTRGSELVALTPKAFDTLVALVEHRGRLVEKETLLEIVWPGTFIEEATLAQNISTIRKALGEGYVETVPKRGYRFTSAVECVADAEKRPKRALWAAIVMVTVLAAGASMWVTGRSEPSTKAKPASWQPRSIAVLPFKSLGGEPSEEYLGLAMADALITKLGNIRSVIVRPTSAVRRYAEPQVDALKAGRDLKTDVIVDGNILKVGDRLRVSVQLLRVSDGASLWSERFDVPFTDIFTVQDRVSEQVVREMMVNLTAAEQSRLIERHTDNPQAYEDYLKGRYFWNKRTETGYVRAIVHFQKAIEADPNFVRAWAGLADGYALLGSMPNNSMRRDVAMPKAREAALRAIALDDTLAEAHTSLAFIRMHYDWDFEGARREFERALELNSGYATAHHWYAYYLLANARFDEAINSARRAEQLDPLSLIISTDVAEMLFYAGRYDESIAQLRRTLDMDPHFPLAHFVLTRNLIEKGEYQQAEAAALKTVKEGRVDYTSLLVYLEAAQGKTVQARRRLQRLEAMYPPGSGLDERIVGFYAVLGEKDRAFAILEEAYRQRSGGLILLRVAPEFEPLRSDRRFLDLERRVGLHPGS